MPFALQLDGATKKKFRQLSIDAVSLWHKRYPQFGFCSVCQHQCTHSLGFGGYMYFCWEVRHSVTLTHSLTFTRTLILTQHTHTYTFTLTHLTCSLYKCVYGVVSSKEVEIAERARQNNNLNNNNNKNNVSDR